MPKDRREDRHASPGRLIRPVPPELWSRLGEKVGERKRNEVISKLIEGFLDGKYAIEDEPPADQP